jgi:3-oxoacyl-[acyl-carrier-protein] synthase II
MMDGRTVVVTGMGLVSPLGCTLDRFWERLLRGESGAQRIAEFDVSDSPSQVHCPVREFEPQRYFDAKEQRRLNRVAQFAVAAAGSALEDATGGAAPLPFDRTGVISGTATGGFVVSEPFFRDYYMDRRVRPLGPIQTMNNGPASHVSIRYGLRGPLLSVDAACASGVQAIGVASHYIRAGLADAIVAGGADCTLSEGIFRAWARLGVLSRQNGDPARACKPFSLDRDGFVPGEGAGMLVLESEASAIRRGARIYGVVAGYGAAADAHDIAEPVADGAAAAMRTALADAGLNATDVDYVHAHGTGTQQNDRVETMAIHRALGAHARRVPVVSTKGATGHLTGAAGAVEAISCLLSLRDGLVPPTANYGRPDPECDLDYVPGAARAARLRTVLKTASAFGGSSAALVLRGHANA